MKKIDGSPKSLKQLLQNTKYSIHYYQREYMWQRKHIEELIDDLTTEFLLYYKSGDDRIAVQDYGAYFMGSIVLAGRENAIIDGQQRFSSLTLLLMYLNNRLRVTGQSYSVIEQMIFSEAYGTKSFNINVDDRAECMNAIFNDKTFDTIGVGESVKNLYGRYTDIVEIFPINDITDGMLLHFCDWLAEKVFFIEIVATTEQDAHKVFVTMNDRGLSLTSTEMLKGYLLSEIKDDTKRQKLNQIWKDNVLSLKKDDDKGDETFIKAWLRAQYAETIRENKAGAINQDFDIIGGPFHKWVRDERAKLHLSTTDDFEAFIMQFSKFAEIYTKIKEAESTFSEETKYIYYNSQVNFTLQPQLLLAPICYDDSWETITEKMNLVARFIDLLITARVTNYRSVDYSTIKNYVFTVSKDIRRCTTNELKQRLKQQYEKLSYDPASALPELRLNSFTKKYIKNMIARITGYIEEQTGVVSKYCEYMDTKTKNPFEIEHIISDHYEWFTDEYADQEEFKRWRNSIGALLLLHKSINASLNDSKYDHKLTKYCSTEGNIYTESLGDLAYQHNPKFLIFVSENNLLFKAYPKFGKAEISERIQLLIQLVKLIWNSEMFN
ncbi:MAG: DUF262 domain-containing HNH endonuclease family protein [Ruminococcus sp.]|nr:DUF262 domain-containing HNH endonuclease family protein [Ruminococcus sp.]